MSERRRGDRDAGIISNKGLLVALAAAVSLIFVPAVRGQTDGRGKTITKCPANYPGVYREVVVDDTAVLRILAKAADAHDIEDTYAEDGISKDIATLDGELACATNRLSASSNGSDDRVKILLPAGLEALRHVAPASNGVDGLPAGLSEATTATTLVATRP